MVCVSAGFLSQQIWVFPHQSVMQLAASFVLDSAVAELRQHYMNPLIVRYTSMPVSARIMAVSVVWLWVSRAIHHVVAIAVITYTSVKDFKQRRPVTLALTCEQSAVFHIKCRSRNTT